MNTRGFSNEFSSPDGIRTHDLFLEREGAEKSGLARSLSTKHVTRDSETRGR